MNMRNDDRPLSISDRPFPSPCSKISYAVPRPVGEPLMASRRAAWQMLRGRL